LHASNPRAMVQSHCKSRNIDSIGLAVQTLCLILLLGNAAVLIVTYALPQLRDRLSIVLRTQFFVHQHMIGVETSYVQ